MDLELAAFEENRLVCDGVERCFERISEAVAKLGDIHRKVQALPCLLLRPVTCRWFGGVVNFVQDSEARNVRMKVPTGQALWWAPPGLRGA